MSTLEPTALKSFLRVFMEDEDIELPVLKNDDGHTALELPESYKKFKASWVTNARNFATQLAAEADAERASGDGAPEFPEGLASSVNASLSKTRRSASDSDEGGT